MKKLLSYVGDKLDLSYFQNKSFDEVFNVEKVKESYSEFCQSNIENSFFVWQWINMEEWFRTFVDNSFDN